MIEAGFDQPESQSGCPIALTFDERDIAGLLDGLFEVTEMRQDHIFSHQVEPYRNYEYIREPWFEAMPEEMFRTLEKSFGWHLLVTARPV